MLSRFGAPLYWLYRVRPGVCFPPQMFPYWARPFYKSAPSLIRDPGGETDFETVRKIRNDFKIFRKSFK